MVTVPKSSPNSDSNQNMPWLVPTRRNTAAISRLVMLSMAAL